MEGLGGPVNLARYSTGGIDPALEDCCRREVVGNRKHNALVTTLRRHDVAALAERRRRHLVKMPRSNGNGHGNDEACRCSCDPNSDGGEYRALIELKERKRNETEVLERENEQREQLAREEAAYERKQGDSNDSDSDDEFDYLLDELDDEFGFTKDDTVRQLEEQRRAELEYTMLMRQFAGYHGYGVHRQLHPNRVLKLAGLGRDPSKSKHVAPPPQAVVLHLVDPDSLSSASLDYYLETELAPRSAGTMFLRSGGRSVLLMDKALARKTLPSSVVNPETDLPALVAIRDGAVVGALPRLSGLCHGGNSDNGSEIEPSAVRQWLDMAGVLLTDAPVDEVCLIRPEEEVHMEFMRSKMGGGEQPPRQQEAAGEEDHYDCGVAGCRKSFKHEHVGIQTNQQSGLVVREEQILGVGVGETTTAAAEEAAASDHENE
mmetsp:Transcript_19553/g.54581  ORF Transcript_19553/g.54581 Transcript_19553/m.54581 type:complete len:433 (+) Transcript_19553:198-1496(+)|eukprot:CAMPEP_0172365130 /NCGR_PEP_ID=MMETSP1060-20121228/8110_1 /TAXON_ID=37318 /ORGANISM="Pseudo-nitzschia pungens, Strain cf. cingulata" /LENGTH=432 /DNA_ID=CAMNT_0013088327 /DNA_START=143 /DNA_END=1441 /DNA_ORIENTATION=-